MNKLSALLFSCLIAFLTLFSLVPESVFADGMAIKFSDRWDYSNETNQQAFINYEHGLQKMIISVGLDAENSEGVVWLFPVPADPSKVVIDVVKSVPQLSGEEISKKAKSNLDGITQALLSTQIYTAVVLLPNMGRFIGGEGITGDVVVYEHIDKEGITSEIVTAKTATGLYDYLKSKGLKIESGAIPVLDQYIGREFSFVASWISSPRETVEISTEGIVDYFYYWYSYPEFSKLVDTLQQKYPDFREAQIYSDYLESAKGEVVLQELIQAIKSNPAVIAELQEVSRLSGIESILIGQRGIFVTFPTKDIYFPMLPTSVYGSKTIPATIRVIGHVSPKIFQDIKSYTKTEYYIDSYAEFGEDLKSFYSGQSKNIKYTKIDISAPSKFLTDDLWIGRHSPLKTYYTSFVAMHPGICAILLLILTSFITGILAGWTVLKELRKNIAKLGLIGLSNCLSLVGLIVVTHFNTPKGKRQFAFVALFSISFLIISCLVVQLVEFTV
jgi:hypothetical protein